MSGNPRRRSVGFFNEGSLPDDSKAVDPHKREESLFEDHNTKSKQIFVKEQLNPNDDDDDDDDNEDGNHGDSNGSRKKKIVVTDRHRNLEEVAQELRKSGLERCDLVLGIDFTASNEENGEYTFDGRSLHDIQGEVKNPYQRVIEIVGKTLASFDDDNLIPTFGFGDAETTNESVFPFFPDRRPCRTFQEVLSRYLELVPTLELSGPTNFGPLIREAIKIVKENKTYHILIIIADGQVVNDADTSHAIVEASNFPLSIVMIGVGDGPWSMMKFFDDSLPKRHFDNFRFVDFNSIISDQSLTNKEAAFAMASLAEIPAQYEAARKLGYL